MTPKHDYKFIAINDRCYIYNGKFLARVEVQGQAVRRYPAKGLTAHEREWLPWAQAVECIRRERRGRAMK